MNSLSERFIEAREEYLKENYANVDPEICKKCKYKWMLTEYGTTINIFCVDDTKSSVDLKALFSYANLDENDKEIIKSSKPKETDTRFSYIIDKSGEVFRLDNISDELKKICERLFIDTSCPYFLEQKLKELYRKEENGKDR